MVEFKIRATTNNISRFTTDSNEAAKQFKEFLEQSKIRYTMVITQKSIWNGTHNIIMFIVFGSRRHNPDLLGKFLDIEKLC